MAAPGVGFSTASPVATAKEQKMQVPSTGMLGNKDAEVGSLSPGFSLRAKDFWRGGRGVLRFAGPCHIPFFHNMHIQHSSYMVEPRGPVSLEAACPLLCFSFPAHLEPWPLS